MIFATVFGYLGDLCTFIGAVVLAYDAVEKDKEFQRVKRIANTLEDRRIAGLRIVMDGIQLETGEQLERVFVLRSVAKAKWGCALLAVGFVFLLVARTAS